MDNDGDELVNDLKLVLRWLQFHVRQIMVSLCGLVCWGCMFCGEAMYWLKNLEGFFI